MDPDRTPTPHQFLELAKKLRILKTALWFQMLSYVLKSSLPILLFMHHYTNIFQSMLFVDLRYVFFGFSSEKSIAKGCLGVTL